jgi:hypothetical protein
MTFAVVALFLGGDGGRDDIPGRLSLLLVITRDVSGDAAFMFSKLCIIMSAGGINLCEMWRADTRVYSQHPPLGRGPYDGCLCNLY